MKPKTPPNATDVIEYQKEVILCLRVQVESLHTAITMLMRAMDNHDSIAAPQKPEGYEERE